MRLVNIHELDVVDGPGVRLGVYCSYCPIRCDGCHNQIAWDKEMGEELNEQHIDNILTKCEQPFYAGLSLLGGEPFADINIQGMIKIATEFRKKFGDTKTIWVYSGFTYEKLLEREDARELLALCDYLVDGPFILAKRNITLQFRGSDNQRIIKLK